MKRIESRYLRIIIAPLVILTNLIIFYYLPSINRLPLSLLTVMYLTIFCGIGWTIIAFLLFTLLSHISGGIAESILAMFWMILSFGFSYAVINLSRENGASKHKRRIDIPKKKSQNNTLSKEPRSHNTVKLILKSLKTLINANTVLLLEKGENKLIKKETVSDSVLMIREEVNPKSGFIFASIKENKKLFLKDIKGDLNNLTYYSQGVPPVQSVVILPIFGGEFVLIIDSLRSINENYIPFVENIGNIIGEVLEESGKLNHYIKLKEEFENFYNISNDLINCSRIEDALIVYSKKIKDIVNFDSSFFIFYDIEKNLNVIKGCEGIPTRYLGLSFPFDPNDNLISWVIKNRVALDYGDVKNNRNIKIFHDSITLSSDFCSCFIVPFASAGNGLGCALFMSRKENNFQNDTRKIIEIISNQVAVILNNINVFSRMEKMATVDGLTGLFNHRYFQESISMFFERVARYPERFSLIICDIDHFKVINDNFGHLSGDMILKEIGKIFIARTRKIDFATRLGGEEFAIILSNTNRVGGHIMAERLRREIQSKQFKSSKGQIQVTCSFGIATYPDDALTKEELIKKADSAMYYAKKSGRNRSVCWGDKEDGKEFSDLSEIPSDDSKVIDDKYRRLERES